MPAPESIGAVEVFKWLWTVLMVPLGWLFVRQNELEKRQNDITEKLAQLPTRQEHQQYIKDIINPINDNVKEIKSNIEDINEKLWDYKNSSNTRQG